MSSSSGPHTHAPSEVVDEAPRPAWIVAFIIFAIIGTLAFAAMTWWQLEQRNAELAQDCQQRVVDRDDKRSMWMALFEAFPNEAAETGIDDQLDIRLPQLVCEGSTPIPVKRDAGAP